MVGKLSSQSQRSATAWVVRRAAAVAQTSDQGNAIPVAAIPVKTDAIQPSPTQTRTAAIVPSASALAIKTTGQRMMRLWLWLMMMLAGTSVSSGSAAIAFSLLMTVPPETDCHNLLPVSDRAILSCGYQAMQADNVEGVVTSLERINHWTIADPLYKEAQQASEQWSRLLLRQAEHLAKQNQLGEAIALIESIPPSSPLSPIAQQQVAALNHQQLVMQPLVDLAHAAMQQHNWAQAQQHIETLAQLPNDEPLNDGLSNDLLGETLSGSGMGERDEWFHFGQRQAFHVNQLSQRLRLEQDNAIILHRVRQTAGVGTPHAIDLALQQAKEINQNTYVWAGAQRHLEPLALELLDHGEWQCQQGDLMVAIATAQHVAIIPALAEEAGYLAQLCQAKQLAIATMTPWTPSWQDSEQLMRAYAMLDAIPASSRFHAHTHHHRRQWQRHLEDLGHLHLAHLAANMGWSPTLAWAVTQTEQVTRQRPRRVQAQTLAAHWQQQLDNTRLGDTRLENTRLENTQMLMDVMGSLEWGK